MSLTPRQSRFYSDRCVLYEPVLTKDPTTGRLTRKVYHRRQLQVPCYFQISPRSSEEPSFLGGIEGDNLLTRDTVHVAGDLNLDSGFILKNVTREPNGAPSKNFGRYWVVSGQPKSVSNRGRRRAFKRQVEAIQFQRPPEGVDPNGLDE